mgnify:CR=1 FL=1
MLRALTADADSSVGQGVLRGMADAMVYSGVTWFYSGMLWSIVGCCGLWWGAVVSRGVPWPIVGCSGL